MSRRPSRTSCRRAANFFRRAFPRSSSLSRFASSAVHIGQISRPGGRVERPDQELRNQLMNRVDLIESFDSGANAFRADNGDAEEVAAQIFRAAVADDPGAVTRMAIAVL